MRKNVRVMPALKTNKILISFVLLCILGFAASSCEELPETPEIPEVSPSLTSQPKTQERNLEETEGFNDSKGLEETEEVVETEELVESEEKEGNKYCSGVDVHPIGLSISQTYDVTYEEVLRLYCSGFTFDNILLAFATSQQTDYDYNPRELLHLKLTFTWEEIWNEIGVLEE